MNLQADIPTGGKKRKTNTRCHSEKSIKIKSNYVHYDTIHISLHKQFKRQALFSVFIGKKK